MAVVMERGRGPEHVCLVEDASKTTEVGSSWRKATVQKVLAQVPPTCPGITVVGQGMETRGHRVLCLEVAENWALEKVLRRQKGGHPAVPPGPLLLPSCW